MAYFPIWLLCASAILSLTHSFNQENLKEAMLQRLGLKELPRIHKRDLENLVVPSHIRNKYLTLLKLHHERRRRSLPSLAGILRGYSGNADISGEILYSDATRERLVFDMEARVPANSEVTMAELRLYQNAPHKLHLAGRKSQKQGNNARVSVYWVEVLENGANRSSLVDSRLVPIYETGWKGFDVTQAVHYWSKGRREVPLRLELRVEGERPGSYAAEMAKSMRFTAQDPSDQSTGKPELLFYTLNLEEYGSRGDCQSSKPNGICCREDHFINFRELTWTQYWVIEPAGYQSFRCAGGCKQPKRHYGYGERRCAATENGGARLQRTAVRGYGERRCAATENGGARLRRTAVRGYGERRCAATENAPLPIMYLVKKGDYTEIEVAEFPNMIVEKCRCTMDNVSV